MFSCRNFCTIRKSTVDSLIHNLGVARKDSWVGRGERQTQFARFDIKSKSSLFPALTKLFAAADSNAARHQNLGRGDSHRAKAVVRTPCQHPVRIPTTHPLANTQPPHAPLCQHPAPTTHAPPCQHPVPTTHALAVLLLTPSPHHTPV